MRYKCGANAARIAPEITPGCAALSRYSFKAAKGKNCRPLSGDGTARRCPSA